MNVVIPMFESMIEILLLVIAISADSFAVSLSYGINRIKIPTSSLLVFSLISSGTLALSLWLGNLFFGILPPVYAQIIGFSILFILGVIKLLESSSKHQADKADRDCNKILSPKESALLGLALSLDSMAAGLGIGLSSIYTLAAIACSFPVSILSILTGKSVGMRISNHTTADAEKIGGLLLVILAFFKFS